MNIHNKNIINNIEIIKKQITELKFNFQDTCIHKWITNYEYIFKNDILTNTNLYEDCDESDIKQILNFNKSCCNLQNSTHNKNINFIEWKKKSTIKNFKEYNYYDRETYHLCEICNYRNTVHFYSK